jgi:hypothetical protein
LSCLFDFFISLFNIYFQIIIIIIITIKGTIASPKCGDCDQNENANATVVVGREFSNFTAMPVCIDKQCRKHAPPSKFGCKEVCHICC